MENKTKILAFAAVALMFAVCFIGFVAINDDAVDAEDAAPAVEKGPLGNMCPDGMTYADGKYTLTKDVTVTLTDNVPMNDVKFVGKYTLTITSEAGKHYALTVNYDFGTKTDKAAGEIFEVSSFVLNGADLNVIQKDTEKTEGPKSNQAGCSVFGTGNVEVKDNSTMTITTNEFANRVFYNNGSSLSINGPTAKVILENATSSTVSLSMTDGATLEIKDPLKTAGNFYPNISNTGKECKITVTGASAGNHGLFFYGTNSNAKDATNGVIKNCVVKSDGIVGFYSNGSVDATESKFEAKELVVAKSVAADMANVKGATFNVTKVGALNPNDDYKPVKDKKLYLDGVTFNGNTVIDSGASLVVEKDKTLTIAKGAAVSVIGTIDGEGTIVNNGTIIVNDAAGLKTAVAAGGKISLANDVVTSETISVVKDITIDLNGHKITGDKIRAIHVKSGTLTLEGTGVVTASETPKNDTSVIRVGDSDNGNKSSAGIVVGEGVTISSDCCYAMSAFGKNTEINVIVNGTLSVKGDNATFGNNGSNGLCKTNVTIGPKGKVLSEKEYAIYFPGDGILNINGTVSGFGALEIKSGTAKVGISNGANIIATANAVTHEKNNNGASTSGYAIAVVENKAYTGMPTVVIEDGSTIIGEIDIIEDDTVANDKKGSITINGGSFSNLSGLAYVVEGKTYNLIRDCTINSDITVKAKTTLNIAKDVTLTTKGIITNEGVIDNKGTITNEGVIITAAGGINISGKLIMRNGSKLTVGGNDIIDGLEIKDGAILTINTNSKGGFDATLNGKATASKLNVSNNDTFTVAKGAELTMTGTFLNAGNVTIDGTLLMTDAGKLQVMKNGIVTINGTIVGGIIDITNVDKDIVCVLFKPNSTITSKIDGTADGKTSIVVLFGIKAGKGGVSVMKGSVIVDGALVEGDVTVPSGSTSFVYGTLEPGATLTIENNAAVNPTGSGSLVVESGAKVVTNSGASIKSVTYKAGSELNGTTFDTDTRVTPEGNVLVAIKIYLNYDDKKLNVSADYVEAFAGDKYVDVLSGVTVSGVNSRITFSGWYNSLDEKITSNVVVPSGGADVILTAHFAEKAKNTVINTGSNDGVDYSVVIAFIVLIGSMVFLCSVLRKR